ncbi:hypothetical protein [Candidatus Korobacter versatilis]|uniref:hypothetical protein n=1 Tax=Candidatus Korobacter versatilis TaxID=658062 RepID=UPI0002E054E1|nr:hypothetical protein [Candidatus Koribacter versatilis]
MSKTFKDSSIRKSNDAKITVTESADGTFNISLNNKVVERGISDRFLDEVVCGKYGFCGNELLSIKHDLEVRGQATLDTSSPHDLTAERDSE